MLISMSAYKLLEFVHISVSIDMYTYSNIILIFFFWGDIW